MLGTMMCGPDELLVGVIAADFHCFFVVLWQREDDKQVISKMESNEKLELGDQEVEYLIKN